KAYVYRILKNPAAAGTYRPRRQAGKRMVPDGEPIPGHYTAVVTEAKWNDAQAVALAERRAARGLDHHGIRQRLRERFRYSEDRARVLTIEAGSPVPPRQPVEPAPKRLKYDLRDAMDEGL